MHVDQPGSRVASPNSITCTPSGARPPAVTLAMRSPSTSTIGSATIARCRRRAGAPRCTTTRVGAGARGHPARPRQRSAQRHAQQHSRNDACSASGDREAPMMPAARQRASAPGQFSSPAARVPACASHHQPSRPELAASAAAPIQPNTPTLAPAARRPLTVSALNTSPARRTAVSTAFCPLVAHAARHQGEQRLARRQVHAVGQRTGEDQHHPPQPAEHEMDGAGRERQQPRTRSRTDRPPAPDRCRRGCRPRRAHGEHRRRAVAPPAASA